MMRFSHPEAFYLFSVLVLFWILEFFSSRYYRRRLQSFMVEDNFRRLSERANPVAIRLRRFLLYLSIIFLIVALAGPQRGTKLKEVSRKGADIFVALDVSYSMLAEDIKPNRLMRAKYEINRLIDDLKGDRIGLIIFAGISYVQCPLTLDYSAARLFLDIADSKLIATQGTAIFDAIKTAVDSYKEGSKAERILIVITDGEDHEGNLEKAIDLAREQGITVYGLGVGTLSGAPIPVMDEKGNVTFKKDRSGHIVTTALKEDFLYQLCQETGGEYHRLIDNTDAMTRIYEAILKKDRETLITHQYSQYVERYQYPLILAFFFLLAAWLIPERVFTKGNKNRVGEYEVVQL